MACTLPGQPTCADPISISTGNVFHQVTDYETAGPNKLSLIRYYNSMAAPDTYATSMGHNWRTNYDRYLHIINPSAIYGVEAERPDGAIITFTSSAGTYTPDSDIDLKLTVSGSIWTLTDQNDNVETYAQSGGEATLQSVKKRGGYTQSIGYSSGQISYVSDSYGRQLGFSYSSAGLLTGVTTPDSLALSYGYITYSSTGSQLQSVSYNTSPTTSQTYLYQNTGFPYALTGIKDENGNQYATWGYDGSGRAILNELSGAINYTSVYYNDANGNRVVKGPLGLVETYKFTTLQGVPKVTEIDCAANGSVKFASEGFTYDSNGYLATKTDWNGNITQWTSNSHGLPTQIVFASTTPNAQVSNITYDLSWPHLQHTVASNGVTSSFTYDSAGNMLTRTDTDTTSQAVPYSTNGQTRTWTYTYNQTGEVLTAQLPRTDATVKTTYTYAGGGALTSIKYGVLHPVTITQSTGGGYPEKIEDINSVLTTLSYNARNWPTSSVIATSAGNLTTSFNYDSAGNLTKETLPDNSYLAYGYDDAHRVTSITNALGETKGITYDSAGDVTQELWKNASGVTTRQHSATYDALGRMLTSVGGMSQTTSYSYDKNGNVLTITDPLSHISYISSDELNRPYRFEDAALDVSGITYDSHSRPLTVTDPRGHVTSYVYDGFGDAIQQDNPDTLTTIFWYDKDANVTGINRAGIMFESATYDFLDRVLTKTYPNDSTLNVAYSYDHSGHGSGLGRLTSATGQTGSLSLSYDKRGLITTDASTLFGTQLYSNTYAYDSAGRYSSITYASSGWKVAYARDAAGQITAITDTQPGHSAVNLATGITHMPFGPASSWTYGNGVTDTRTFDQDYRMTSVRDTGTSDIQYLSYSYNAADDVTGIADNVTPANTQTLGYDPLGRIDFASGSYGMVSGIAYDSNSNRTAYGAISYTIPGTSDRMSKAGAASITYNSTGNYASNGSDTQSYYQTNQLATNKVGGHTSTYWYDPLGRRLILNYRGDPIRIESFDLDGHLITQTSGTSIVETDYVYLDGIPLYAVKPVTATLSALHTDKIGTMQRATNASQAIVWTCNYDPFGGCAPTTSIVMNLRLPGMSADKTGYYHGGFRDYVPAYGRYIEADPIGLAGGTNPYPYALGNPGKYTDPSGLCPFCLIVAPEAAEALSAGVAEVAEALEANEALQAAEAAQQAAAQREAAENAARAARNIARLFQQPQEQPSQTPGVEPGAQCTAPQGTGTALAAPYPPFNGFVEPPVTETLQEGQIIDRYGANNGSFASPQGTPASMRSLPSSTASMPLNTFRVAKPFDVQSGMAGPYYGQPGGGTQYQLPVPVQHLIDSGYLEDITGHAQ